MQHRQRPKEKATSMSNSTTNILMPVAEGMLLFMEALTLIGRVRIGIAVIHCVFAVGINAGIITYALRCAAHS